MSSRLLRTTSITVALSALCVAPRCSAQELAVNAVTLSANDLLRDAPLWGGNVSLRFRLRDGGVAIYFGSEWALGDRTATGVPCAGLIPPGGCAPEQVRDESRLRTGDVGAAFRVLGNAHASLAVTADLLAGSVRRESRGLTSGRSLSAEKRMWGGRVGAESRWQPWAGTPLDVQLGVSYGELRPFSTAVVVDGYTPFEQSMRVRRILFGGTWRFSH